MADKALKKNNIKKVALIFEGGGMRCAFSSGIANSLVENNLFFDYIAGISRVFTICSLIGPQYFDRILARSLTFS